MKKFLALLLLFSCFAEQAPKPLVFFVIGDWGRMGSTNQREVALQMNEWAKKENPEFIITTGDNFYDVGVADVNDLHWQKSFLDVYNGNTINNKSWYATLGNHDYVTNPQAEVAYTATNQRWQMPARYYQNVMALNDGARIRFVFSDTSPFEKSYYTSSFSAEIKKQDTLQQKKWLDSLTALSDVDWKIVVGHHHIYTGGIRKNDPNSVRQSLEPVFIKNNVDVYFCGHEHDLQHLKVPDRPTHYFLSGAGSDTRPTTSIAQTLFGQSVLGFMSVTVAIESLTVKVINNQGQVIYQYTIAK
ncbi:MAG: metallophosphoesterase [Bacteroidetes bacterium]|nr:metallophosphoesterase [Bacteroidota bacterium]